MPALPHAITATLPVPGLNASVGCGNFTPVVFENVSTAAAAAALPEPALLVVVVFALLVEDELLFELPHPAANTSAVSSIPVTVRLRVLRPIFDTPLYSTCPATEARFRRIAANVSEQASHGTKCGPAR
jgi:hypothetical protein